MSRASRASADAQRILALVPASRRLGFAVLEPPTFPVDWGLCDLRNLDRDQIIERSVEFVEWYFPDIVILEDPHGDGFRRGPITREVIDKIASAAAARKIPVTFATKAAVRAWAAARGQYGKHGLCRAVAQELPELQPKIPPLRRAWESEHHRMPVFEAFGMAFVFRDQDRTASPPES